MTEAPLHVLTSIDGNFRAGAHFSATSGAHHVSTNKSSGFSGGISGSRVGGLLSGMIGSTASSLALPVLRGQTGLSRGDGVGGSKIGVFSRSHMHAYAGLCAFVFLNAFLNRCVCICVVEE